jgi:hypothetical protein
MSRHEDQIDALGSSAPRDLGNGIPGEHERPASDAVTCEPSPDAHEVAVRLIALVEHAAVRGRVVATDEDPRMAWADHLRQDHVNRGRAEHAIEKAEGAFARGRPVERYQDLVPAAKGRSTLFHHLRGTLLRTRATRQRRMCAQRDP